MRVDVVRPKDLSADHLAHWQRLQAADPALGSPYLCHQFASALGRLRTDVFVAVIEHDGRISGFLPFQRKCGILGVPLGGRLSDVQAVIGHAGEPGEHRALLEAAGLTAFAFTNLLAGRGPFPCGVHEVRPSHLIDLSNGYDAYAEGRQFQGSTILKEVVRKASRLAAVAGPLRFVAHETSADQLAVLQAWKTEQYRRTRAANPFALDWVRRLLDDLLFCDEADFGGMLSTLWAGDQLAAIHFGMRSHRIWHYWFPAYNQRFARYSPGSILVQQMAAHAAGRGLAAIDLGRGDYLFKTRFSNACVGVARGMVSTHRLPLQARRLRHGIEDLAQQLPVGRYNGLPRGLFRRVEMMLLS